MRSAMQSDKKGLTARDLVTCGVFIALYFVFMMVGSMLFAPNPRADVPHAGGCGPAHRPHLPAAGGEGRPSTAPSSSWAWWRGSSCS